VIDPDEILLQAVRSQIPPDWDVFEGQRPAPKALGCCFAVAALLIGTVLSVLLIIVIALIRAISHSQAFNPFTTFVSLGPIIGIAIVAIALGAGALGVLQGRRDADDPDPVIVVMPNGFVEFFLLRRPPRIVAFAELADVQLEGYGRIAEEVTLDEIELSLYLIYKDGRKERWHPQAHYEDKPIVKISVAAAYEHYARPQSKPRFRKKRRRNREK
jgi:hypothetical protein